MRREAFEILVGSYLHSTTHSHLAAQSQLKEQEGGESFHYVAFLSFLIRASILAATLLMV
ncbi:hypothetical protein E2C01_007988 [Portunus trituberculatus]|uniref:Uncharacterized protein n=1 Tax=Portunus trituberculatus TaxID=210409 RepID=A0A5B7D518_PORTR|nr:hypothetical protein [Portunus trituberculatus]